MNPLPAIKLFCKKGGKWVTKHSPTILTAFGVCGTVSSVIFAIKATPKAMILIEKRKQELEAEKLSPIDTVKACWKVYIPAAATMGVTIGCIIGANSINLKRNAALAGLYATTEQTLREYQKKVVEKIGEEKEHLLAADTTKEKLKTKDILKEKIESTGIGDELCYDETCDRFFRSDYNTLKAIENDVRELLISQMYISANEVYDMMHLAGTQLGADLGWSVDDGFRILIDPIRLDDGQLCHSVRFSVLPHENYYKMY